MAYITREDGEHFVIPSYRDVLTAKQKRLLKRDILVLSQSYGEYITLQKKGGSQYEVAFSPDTGYLLGESIWHFFKRPLDMVYCEAIPNTTEAILVIVKSGSVYLDGSFPLESIPEELVIFLTQQNNFEVYIYGNVPISQTVEEGKFNFEASSIKSFTVLDAPVFPNLPLLKIYQLQLVDQVLRAHSIGVFPTRQIITGIVAVGLFWMLWTYFTTPKEIVEEAPVEVNPYQQFNTVLTSPAPDEEIQLLLNNIAVLMTIPGWMPTKIDYAQGTLTALMQSSGSKVEDLLDWAKAHAAQVNIKTDGVYLSLTLQLAKRPVPQQIYPLKETIAAVIDRIATVYPGNRMQMGDFLHKGTYTEVTFAINLENSSPLVLGLIGAQLKNLPLVLQKVSLTVDNGNLSGSLSIQALGN